MEQNTDAGTPMASVIENKQKNGNGLKIATVIACVVAVCGIGFSIYGIMQSFNKDDQISDLKNQIDSLKSKISSLEINNNDENANNDAGDGGSTVVVNSNSKDYIYIGEWGIRIKIPENLIGKVGYIFSDNNYLEITDYASVYTYDGGRMDWDSNSVLRIARSKAGEIDFENCRTSCSKLITTLNGYDYSYVLSGNNLELLQNTALNEMAKEDAFSEF